MKRVVRLSSISVMCVAATLFSAPNPHQGVAKFSKGEFRVPVLLCRAESHGAQLLPNQRKELVQGRKPFTPSDKAFVPSGVIAPVRAAPPPLEGVKLRDSNSADEGYGSDGEDSTQTSESHVYGAVGPTGGAQLPVGKERSSDQKVEGRLDASSVNEASKVPLHEKLRSALADREHTVFGEDYFSNCLSEYKEKFKTSGVGLNQAITDLNEEKNDLVKETFNDPVFEEIFKGFWDRIKDPLAHLKLDMYLDSLEKVFAACIVSPATASLYLVQWCNAVSVREGLGYKEQKLLIKKINKAFSIKSIVKGAYFDKSGRLRKGEDGLEVIQTMSQAKDRNGKPETVKAWWNINGLFDFLPGSQITVKDVVENEVIDNFQPGKVLPLHVRLGRQVPGFNRLFGCSERWGEGKQGVNERLSGLYNNGVLSNKSTGVVLSRWSDKKEVGDALVRQLEANPLFQQQRKNNRVSVTEPIYDSVSPAEELYEHIYDSVPLEPIYENLPNGGTWAIPVA